MTTQNRLLASLPPASLAQLMPKLTLVPLGLRDEIYHSDGPVNAVWFPQSGMISLVKLLGDGMQAEVGLIGREGVAGASLMAGVATSFSEAFVQLPGTALKMAASDFRAEFDASQPFRAMLLRYNEALHAQVMQTAACNGRHGLEQRLARWILMAYDRGDGADLSLTQDFLAMMLGVHRPSITVTAGILQRAGLIRYAGGRVTVPDRTALEAASCECYEDVRKRFADLLGVPTS
jgi:CRP-like cAMP-binding protein